jgi:hypothetical protein
VTTPGLIEAEEDAVIDAQFRLHDLMWTKGITRQQLARKIRIGNFFAAEANPTLRKVARIEFILNNWEPKP